MHLPLTFAVVLLATLSSSKLNAQEEGNTDRQSKILKHWEGISREYAEAMTLEAPSKLRLLDKPIFRHTQSVRGDDIGAVHLWVDEAGHPAVVGSIFAWTRNSTSRMVSIEFHSLLEEGDVQLTHGDRSLWRNSEPGIKWESFPKELTPASTKASLNPVRLKLIARQLSRRFSAKTEGPKDEQWQLRFIPKPIYEYVDKDGSLAYGALFAFCQGTDSEVLLLLEAVKGEDGKARWRYGLVPFTDYDITVSLGKEEIWQSPEGQMDENGKPHYWTLLESSPKPEFEKK